ncbi:glucosidase [Actinocrinis puniceicyclus]|uniref:Glucosidase n=1 Tax=Actinocrinis puniceicyclus TaxID=977794 RepID=A0A8J7WJ55_9ACTN|nr:glucosidase [Actinocrinis puniceicyclus]MBS2963271.1 glucosidase [Actinocrinis puniceicyclus]
MHEGVERRRLKAADEGTQPWREWGPYLSERAWGTVREDYSADGNAWRYFPFDHARSRAYRWSEDGLAGLCNLNQDWCFALGLWNGRDPILKERAFGLGNDEGNHGEDAKDYWWYEDATPTGSWLRWRYHYPQGEFPYQALRDQNAVRGKDDPEYELIDTGIFAEDRYFVVTADYAKAAPDAYALVITAENAGPERATLHVLPHLWFRDMWSWGRAPDIEDAVDTEALLIRGEPGRLTATHPHLAAPLVLADADGERPPALLCDNETNAALLFGAQNRTQYPKDGIGDHVVRGAATVNPENVGTKGALHYVLDLAPGERREIRLWLAASGLGPADHAGVLAARQAEADEFYAALAPADLPAEDAWTMRQAFAGLVWSQQFYHYDVHRWLNGDPDQPLPPDHRADDRNAGWDHFWARDVLLMPDPWEYPWFAAWDLAFHCAVMAEIDPGRAKQQLYTFLSGRYQHPNGQVPAYEWNFDDVNPPVLAWAALRVHRAVGGDLEFLKACFHKLLLNFTFWVNRKDEGQDNIFEGGFLGLDNIGVFDRSRLPVDGVLEQSDGTGWMAFFCLHMLEISIELAGAEPIYEEMACKFAEHYAYIAKAINDHGLWDEQDGFYYDRLRRAGNEPVVIRVRSMVGAVPLLAAIAVEADTLKRLPRFTAHLAEFTTRRPEYARAITRPHAAGGIVFSLADDVQAGRLLERLGDPEEFFSPHGLRSLSRYHRDHPFAVQVDGCTASVDYEPGESHSGMFGGNSNWRGPVWMPLNYLVYEVVCRVGPVLAVTAHPVPGVPGIDRERFVGQLRQRLAGIFRLDPDGTRPVLGASAPGADPGGCALGESALLQRDPRWRDRPWFFEYFHGDTGKGLGASHQTGWTALIASLIRNPPSGFPVR